MDIKDFVCIAQKGGNVFDSFPRVNSSSRSVYAHTLGSNGQSCWKIGHALLLRNRSTHTHRKRFLLCTRCSTSGTNYATDYWGHGLWSVWPRAFHGRDPTDVLASKVRRYSLSLARSIRPQNNSNLVEKILRRTESDAPEQPERIFPGTRR